MKTHKDLDVWQEGISLVIDVYKIIKQFPSEERFGLVDQIKRSAVSIPSNIAEGAARNSGKDFIRFLHISLGSLAELETQLIISNKLKFISYEELGKFDSQFISIRKKILGLIKYLKKKLDE